MDLVEYIIVIVVGVLTVLGLYLYSISTFKYWAKRNVKYSKPVPIFGSLWNVFTFKRSIGCHLKDIYDQFPEEDYVGMWTFTRPGLVIRNPDIIRAILLKDFQHFRDRTIYSDSKADPLGSNNVFSIKDPHWKFIRTKLSPVFSTGKLKSVIGLLDNAGKDLVDYIDRRLNEGEDELYTKEYCANFTTDSIASVAFGVEARCFKDPDATFRYLGKLMFEPSTYRCLEFAALFFSPFIAKIWRCKFFSSKCSHIFQEVFTNVMQTREANPIQRNDLINLLIELKRQVHNGEHELEFEDITLMSQAVAFFTAGFETSSSAMSFTLYEFAYHQDIQEKAYQNIMEQIKKHNGEINYESVNEMEYLEWCFNESLRKYPTLPFLDRICCSKYKMPGTNLVVEPGTLIYIPVMGLQHDKKHFENPEVFDPERFAKKTFHRYSYLPFGEGPRICLGERFGVLQGMFALACFLSKYKVDVCDSTPEKIVLHPKSVMSKPKHDFKLKITRR